MDSVVETMKGWNPLNVKSPHAKKLLNWKQGDEEDKWAEKAVDALVKKLKKQKVHLDTLERQLSFPGNQEPCVTIPRSLDGRLQVSHRKGLPHVIYCRVWRFPDLQSHHELKPEPWCKHPFKQSDTKQKDVCINPYHYARIGSPGLPPVLVPRFSDPMPAASMMQPTYQQHMLEESMPQNISYNHNGTFNAPPMVTHPMSPPGMSTGEMSPHFIGPGSPQYNYPMEAMVPDQKPSVQEVPYQDPMEWCKIAYYELNNRVGELFYAKGLMDVFIDGFTSPGSDANRFCLGQLSNVNRTSSIEQARRHIGIGVRLAWSDGKVWVECLSDSPIFIQSKNANRSNGFNESTVVKISKGMSLIIFDGRAFANQLEQAVQHGYEHTYGIQKYCTIRMSFCKGWGADYHRQDVTSTPCWVEIHLTGPLLWLDNVLRAMNPPANYITSNS